MTVNFMENYRKRNISMLEGSNDIFQPDSIVFKESMDSSMTVQYVCGVCSTIVTEFQSIVLEYYQEGVVDGVINFIKKIIDFIIKLLKGLISLLIKIFNKIWGLIKGVMIAIKNIFTGGSGSSGGGGGGTGGNSKKKPPVPPKPPAGSNGTMRRKIKKIMAEYATDPWKKGFAEEIRKDSKKAEVMANELGEHIANTIFKNMSSVQLAEMVSVMNEAKGRLSQFGFLLFLSDDASEKNSLISTLTLMCSNMKTFKESLDKIPSFVDSNGQLDSNMKHIHDNLKITMDKEELDKMGKLYSKIDEAVISSGRVNNTFVFDNNAIVDADLLFVVEGFMSAVSEFLSGGNDMTTKFSENKKTLNTVAGMCTDMVKVAEGVKKTLEEKGIDKVREYVTSGAKPSKDALTVSGAIKDRVMVFMNELKIILGLTSEASSGAHVFADLVESKMEDMTMYNIAACMFELYDEILTPEEAAEVRKAAGVYNIK